MSQRQWYYIKGGEQQGPVSEAALVQLFRQRTLGPETYLWTQQLKAWCKASQVSWLLPMPVAPTPAMSPAASQPLGPARPAPVTVFGILNIVFGSLGLLSIPCIMFVIFVVPEIMNPTSAAKAWMTFSSIVAFACTVLLIAIGIGLLNLKAWARIWCLGYGWFAIVWTVLGTIINFALMASGAYQYSEESLGGAIGGLFGAIVSLVYPVLLIVFMSRPNVKSACTE